MSEIRDIPQYFLERYQAEFNAWAAQIPTGEFHPTRWFAFNDGDLAPWSPDREQGRAMLGAWLFAKRWVGRDGRNHVEIEPYRESDKEAIFKHCERMRKAGIPAWARLAEPARPGIPGLPFGKGNGHAN